MNTVSPSTILIVDDTPTNLNVLFDFLRNSGFKVLVAQSGKSALQKVEYAKPDLILLDILMPEMDGFETCQILKSRPSTQETPIIFMTALSETVDKVKGLRLGAVDYITKPFQQEEVLARIQLHLNLRNLTRQIQEQNAQLEQEIQERIQAEERVRQREAQLRLLTDALPVMISYIDREHNYRFVNRGYEDWFQCSREDLENHHMRDLMEDELYKELLPKLELALSGQTVTFDSTLTREGHLHHFEFAYVPHFDDDEVQGTYVLMQDVTERKQLERQLLRSQRMESLGTLASGIAHDLNNVLTPILMSVQLLAMKHKDEQSQQWLKLVERNTKRGADLIRQVMSFVRGIEGTHTLIQPDQLLREIKQIIDEIFPKSITISTHIIPELWAVSGDSTQLHQVLMNLCVNARDAMPQGGQLKLGVENLEIDPAFVHIHPEAKVGSYVLISVADTGVGIPPDVIDRIFDPFFTTKEFGQGTGLGLSTVLGIVKSHGGFITVSSKPDVGTQFNVYLPAIAPAVPLPSEDNELPIGHGETVLIVDDEAAIREIAKHSLEAFGYQTLTANDGLEAISIYVQHPQKIDLVIVDMMMPSMDGSLAIRALKEINPDVRIVAISGLITSETCSNLTDTDVLAFLPKPFTTKDLLTTLSKIVKR
ncbi:response regulator [Leptolyngbya sp. FACHB-8]|uniref:ATP-binding response regulator n=1 Tax=unclassified Leptolyngbya TaxID=2650499 RepID=UPI0016834C9F|nr:response regulator [Leptolyngbya sp. FACHB-8]MBD1909378.1 response regulator [Leptolyngbya sp. FACHB-8]